MGNRSKNPWIIHLKSVMKTNKGKPLKEVMKIAKKSYHKRR